MNQIGFWGPIRLVFDRPAEKAWYVGVQRFRLTDSVDASSVLDAAGPPLTMAPVLGLLKSTARLFFQNMRAPGTGRRS